MLKWSGSICCRTEANSTPSDTELVEGRVRSWKHDDNQEKMESFKDMMRKKDPGRMDGWNTLTWDYLVCLKNQSLSKYQ